MSRIVWLMFFWGSTVFGQLHVDSLSHVNYAELHDTYLNDVWGYTDETGKEYVLVGARKGTGIVDISDPSQPIEVFWEPGLESVWRDIKTWGNYAYVTTEAENGLLMLDLSSLPDPTGISASYYQGPSGSTWQSAHNLYIDEQGYAYVFGANRGEGGVIILDVHSNPLAPTEVGVFDTWYCHDGFVRNDTMFLAHINDGFFSIVDVSDRANPQLIATQTTPSNFTHNIWPSEANDVVFTTDEVSGAFLAAYDVSDPQNIRELDRIRSNPDVGTVPHNVHYRNGFLLTSYYGDGLTVHDVHHPTNMVEVGHFDTYPGTATTTIGCWGVYPFFESGIAAVTDIENGLFILQPSYQRASYVTGIVRDAATMAPLSGVAVQFEDHNQVEQSKLDGSFETGIVREGLVELTFSKVAYYPQTLTVQLAATEWDTVEVDLVPIPPFQLLVNVWEAGTNLPIMDAQLRFASSLMTQEFTTNGIGEVNATLYYQEPYVITVGKWGFRTQCVEQVVDGQTQILNFYLEKGYYDDFVFDFGWTSSAVGATQGFWERGIPFQANQPERPNSDALYDCGTHAFLTGNASSFSAGSDDVANGRVTLYSPVFDLSTQPDAYLHYTRWFFSYHGPVLPFDDTLEIFLSNGIQTVLLDAQGPELDSFYRWIPRSFLVSSYLPLTETMQLIVTVSDDTDAPNITEAGFDFFFISDQNELNVDQPSAEVRPMVYPNPSNDWWNIRGVASNRWLLMDVQGRVLRTGAIDAGSASVPASDLAPGTYWLSDGSDHWQVVKR